MARRPRDAGRGSTVTGSAVTAASSPRPGSPGDQQMQQGQVPHQPTLTVDDGHGVEVVVTRGPRPAGRVTSSTVSSLRPTTSVVVMKPPAESSGYPRTRADGATCRPGSSVRAASARCRPQVAQRVGRLVGLHRRRAARHSAGSASPEQAGPTPRAPSPPARRPPRPGAGRPAARWRSGRRRSSSRSASSPGRRRARPSLVVRRPDLARAPAVSPNGWIAAQSMTRSGVGSGRHRAGPSRRSRPGC